MIEISIKPYTIDSKVSIDLSEITGDEVVNLVAKSFPKVIGSTIVSIIIASAGSDLNNEECQETIMNLVGEIKKQVFIHGVHKGIFSEESMPLYLL